MAPIDPLAFATTYVFPCGDTLDQFGRRSRDERVGLAEHDKLIFAFYYLPTHFNPAYGVPPCLAGLFQFLEHRYIRAVVLAWRGFGKSTIVSLAEVLHETYYRRSAYTLLLSQSFEVIQDNHDTLKRELADNPKLFDDFGPMKPVIDRRIGGDDNRWAIGDIITATGCRIRSRGMKQRIRGTKYDQFRPHLVVPDDPEDETNTRSGDELRTNLRWLNKSVIGALDPQYGRILAAGNLICPGCMVHTLAGNRFWKHYSLDILQPDNATPTWPEKFPAAWVQDKRDYLESMGDYDAFDLEYRNRADTAARAGFLHDDTTFWEGQLVVREQYSYVHVQRVGHYAGPTDLTVAWEDAEELVPVTVSHGKDVAFTAAKYSDFNVDVIVATAADGRRFVVAVDEYREACPTRVIDHTFAQWQEYRPHYSGLETHGGQVYLATAIQMDPRWEELERQPGLTPLDHQGVENDKEARILGTLQPLDHAGRLLFKKDMKNALDQRRQMPHRGRGHDDVLDAIEMAVAVSLPPPEATIHEWAWRHQHRDEPRASMASVPRPWMVV